MELKAGYKKTDTGIIPAEWNAGLIGDIAITFSGGTPDTKNADFYGEDIDWITSSDLNKSQIFSVDGKITKKGLENSSAKLVTKGTLLIALYGATAGVTAITRIDGAINQAVLAIIPRRDCTEYLYQILTFWKERIIATYTQGGQPNLSGELVRQLRLPLPPIPEQRAIAAVLGDVDALIAALDRLIAKKRDIKRAAMQELLTGKRRLQGFGEDWEHKTIGSIFSFLRTANNPRDELSEIDGIGYLHYGDIHTKWRTLLDLDKADLPKIPEHKAEGYPRLQNGDLIIADASEDYDGVGVSVEVQNIRRRAVISGLHTLLLREKHSMFAPGFKGYIQYMPEVRSQLIRIATGVSVYSISRDNLAEVLIPVPPLEEQIAIKAILSDMDAEIAALEKRREKTLALKQGMMQELLTGRIRLVQGGAA